MVQVNEIRIGNLIKSSHIHEAKTKQIKHINTQVNPSVVFYEDSVVGDYIKDIEPIPLTPEILEKCGFERCKSKMTMRATEDVTFAHQIGDDLVYTMFWHSTGGDSFGHPIKYLHQLQNLYFALTQTELTVKM